MRHAISCGLVFLLFIVAGCGAPEECVCPTVYNPVCGVDNETYSNQCRADCAGVEIAHKGECTESVELELTSMGDGTTDPVPGVHEYEEGATVTVEAIPDSGYQFSLWEREGSATACDAEARECSFTINEDSLLSAHFTECECMAVYDPVCGVDNKTYSNACRAECARVEIAYQGECT